ncbi:1866_t:CDS:1 [Entrophospora sp. SA101]|nr:3558_t:CDS:1 [Entrophospora sp. SA101]CAJ0635102.1 1866_t:CDS:1 [Entrophospora sp. SA101]CAJ0824872.1 15586_t:CDS:1 [Entrophospora sp. SA101]CAJ0867863.1 2807_t:CDS:1 [Entrophospora sp. SA101]CAJ0923408.1 20885_t:CDS:1 [Entrophospora sp. SA101]
MTSSSYNFTIIDSSIAAMISRIITHPLDTIRVRLQTSTAVNSNINNFVVSAAKINVRTSYFRNLYKYSIRRSPLIMLIRNTSLMDYYNGLLVATLLGVPASSTYLYIYDKSKYYISDNFGIRDDKMINHMISGTIAEIVSGAFWTPMEVLKSKLQIQDSTSGSNTLSMIKRIVRIDGVLGFFRGYWMSLYVYVPHTILYFTTYEKLKQINFLNKNNTSSNSNIDYAIYSSISITIAGSISNILDVVKTRWQTIFSNQQSIKSPIDIIKSMYINEGGLIAFTKGMSARVLWMIPSSSISMTVYEILKNNRNNLQNNKDNYNNNGI